MVLPSLDAFAGVVSAPSSGPFDMTEALLFRGGMLDGLESDFGLVDYGVEMANRMTS